MNRWPATAYFISALERAIKSNSPCVIDVSMQNEPVPTFGHWNIMDIYSPGKKVHHVGIPIHWGFVGVAKNGYLSNTLTPFVGDANSQTPEFKAFLVNIEKA